MVNKKLLFVISLLITVSLILTGCFGNTSSTDTEIKEAGEVVGQITEPLGSEPSRPASGMIELEGENNYKTYATAQWDNVEGEPVMVGGTFSEQGVKEGSYTVKIHKIGYETATKNITVSPNTTNDLGSIKLSLKESFNQNDGLYMYLFNRNVEPFNDPAVREALGYAIDWNDYSNFLQPPATEPANRIMTPRTEGYTTEQVTHDFNIDKAEEILSKAGYFNADSLDITISVIVTENNKTHLNIAEKIQTYWEQINQVNVIIDDSYSTYSNYISDFNDDKIGIRYFAFVIDNPDPLFYLESMENYIGYDSEEQKYLKDARMSLDDTNKALDYLYNLEESIINTGKVLPLHYLELNR